MNWDEYKIESARTATLTDPMRHAALGLVTESAELLDMIKRRDFYSTVIGHTHLKEELGDVFWYLALAARNGAAIDPVTMGAGFEDLIKSCVYHSAYFLRDYDEIHLTVIFSCVQAIATLSDMTLEEVLEANINKLRVRYPDGFNIVDANIRDLDAEEECLSKK